MITKPMKKETKVLTQNQRNAVLAMLKPYDHLWEIAHKTFDAAHDALVDSLVREEAKTKGWLPAIDECFVLKNRLSGFEAQLASHGVEIDERGALSFTFGQPPLKLVIESKICEKIGDRNDVRTMFADARAKLLTAQTFDDADAVLQPIINFSVKAK